MKARTTILSIVAASALIVPAAQARTDDPAGDLTPSISAQTRAMNIRGDALNRRYHLGRYQQSSPAAIRAQRIRGEALNRMYGLGSFAPLRFSSDVANSNAVAASLANKVTSTPDALGRYLNNVTGALTGAATFSSDVANSNAVSRFQAAGSTNTSDALTRYVNNTTGELTATPSFSSDVANSNAVSRFQASHGTSVSTGDGVLQSPAIDAGLAIGLLLASAGCFVLVRRSHRPVRPA